MTKLTNADFDRIRAETQAALDEYHLPGIGIGIVSGDDLVFAEGFGFADIESGKKQAPEVRQRIGSITKTMTALCVMALVDEGRLSLTDRLADRVPELKFHGPGDKITLRHMLTHTSGIGEAPLPTQVRDIGASLWSEEPFDLSVEEAYPEGIAVEVEPGTRWAYANHAFILLGEILKRTEGLDSIDAVLRKRVFEPLGMTNTDCHDLPHKDLSAGYHRPPDKDAIELAKQSGAKIDEAEGEPVDGHNYRGHFQHVRGGAAGAVQATVLDMAKYASALLRKSAVPWAAGIVKPETFDQMIASQWCPDDRLQNIGYAFFRERRFGRFAFEHGGGVVGGWGTGMWIFPEQNLALLSHCNMNTDKPINARVMRALFDAPEEKAPERAVDPDVLASAPGVYQAPMPGPLTNLRIITGTGRIQISKRDGGLVLHARRGPWKDGVHMLPADEDDPAFFALETDAIEAPHVVLLRNGDGAVTGLRFDRLSEMERTSDDLAWV